MVAMFRSVAVTLCMAACAALAAGLKCAPAETAEVQLLTESGSRDAQVKIQRISRAGAADAESDAAVLLSVFDPRTTQYWWAVFRDPAPPVYTGTRFQREVLAHMRFVAEPSQVVGFFTVLSQLRIRPLAIRAVSLDAAHDAVRATAAAPALAGASAKDEWKIVQVPNPFVVGACDPPQGSPQQLRPVIIDIRHENRRWYVTLKNECGERRVLTLSESFELLD
jgi:hypothetical protein